MFITLLTLFLACNTKKVKNEYIKGDYGYECKVLSQGENWAAVTCRDINSKSRR